MLIFRKLLKLWVLASFFQKHVDYLPYVCSHTVFIHLKLAKQNIHVMKICRASFFKEIPKLGFWANFSWCKFWGNTSTTNPWWRHQMETFSALLALVWGIHRSPIDSPHKGQWRRALLFSLIFAWTNGWVNNRDAGDLRRHLAHNDVTVMTKRWVSSDNIPARHVSMALYQFPYLIIVSAYLLRW